METDHKSLEWIKSAKDPRGKLARWALRLQEYDFTISHVPGRDNHLPDILSRKDDTVDVPNIAFGVSAIAIEGDPVLLQQAQRSDIVIGEVIRKLLTGEQPDRISDQQDMTVLATRWADLWINAAGILMIRDGEQNSVPVIPTQYRRNLVEECHQLAHTGCNRTYEMLKQRAYWPGLRRDVTAHVLSCEQCQRMKGNNRTNNWPTQPIPVSNIGELWSIDIMGPFPMTTSGNQYVVVMTEHFTRWIEAAPVPDQRAVTVCKAVMDRIIANHGVPQRILTDQGPCFESDEFRQCMQRMGVKRIRTTPYHPQTNGLTERNNRTIKEWLATKGGNWEEQLPLVLLAYRASPQTATGSSPFELIYGRLPRLPVDQAIGVWSTRRMTEPEIANSREKANWRLQNTQQKAQEQSTSILRGRYKIFPPGAKVKYRDHRAHGATGPGSRKFLPRWRGPYEVVERQGPVYLIRNDREHHRVHASQLATWHEYRTRNNEGLNQGTPGAPIPERRSTRLRREPQRLLLELDTT